jgi:hypothetical protein
LWAASRPVPPPASKKPALVPSGDLELPPSQEAHAVTGAAPPRPPPPQPPPKPKAIKLVRSDDSEASAASPPSALAHSLSNTSLSSGVSAEAKPARPEPKPRPPPRPRPPSNTNDSVPSNVTIFRPTPLFDAQLFAGSSVEILRRCLAPGPDAKLDKTGADAKPSRGPETASRVLFEQANRDQEVADFFSSVDTIRSALQPGNPLCESHVHSRVFELAAPQQPLFVDVEVHLQEATACEPLKLSISSAAPLSNLLALALEQSRARGLNVPAQPVLKVAGRAEYMEGSETAIGELSYSQCPRAHGCVCVCVCVCVCDVWLSGSCVSIRRVCCRRSSHVCVSINVCQPHSP